MKKFAILSLLLFFTYSISQEILLKFPEGQKPYIGGYAQFYKDFNKILMDKNLTPCENKNDVYKFDVLIKADSKISFVADPADDNEQESKCAKDLTREVAKYLSGWNPAVKDGKPVPAIANFVIVPDQLFGTLKEGYDLDQDKQETLPEFPGGLNEFRVSVANNINLSQFKYDQTFRLEVMFVVEKDGTIQELKLERSSGLKKFDDMVLRSISKIKKKWKPATIYNMNVRYRFKIPLVFQSE